MNIKIEHVFAKVPRYALKLATNVSNAVAEAGADLIGDKAAMLIGAAAGALVCMLIMAAYALVVRLKLHIYIRHHLIHRRQENNHATGTQQETRHETVISIFSAQDTSQSANNHATASIDIHNSHSIDMTSQVDKPADDIIDIVYDQFDPLRQPNQQSNYSTNSFIGNNMFDPVNRPISD